MHDCPPEPVKFRVLEIGTSVEFGPKLGVPTKFGLSRNDVNQIVASYEQALELAQETEQQQPEKPKVTAADVLQVMHERLEDPDGDDAINCVMAAVGYMRQSEELLEKAAG